MQKIKSMKNLLLAAIALLALSLTSCRKWNCNHAHDEYFTLPDGREGYRIVGRGKVVVYQDGRRIRQEVELPHEVIEPISPWSWECD